MAKRPSSRRNINSGPGIRLDLEKFDNIHQVAGIQCAQLAPGTARATNVAFVNTGSGLRFTVALDRGGDIVDAFFNRFSLAYLSPNGIKPPNHAYHHQQEWLHGWPGGLLTTCGPQYIGHPRVEDGIEVGLHGHYSNSPAQVEMIINPDPHRGRNEMLLSMVVRDSRMFGPIVEVRRTIQGIIGRPQIHIYDQVTNRGDIRCPHHWLYHVNAGYPLLDRGATLIYGGQAEYWQLPRPPATKPTDEALNRLKKVPGPLAEHVGAAERGMIVQVKADRDGQCHVGLINRRLGLGLELMYAASQLPRLANWHHFGPRGAYVTGIEPFSGSLMGKHKDDFTGAEQYLEPGQTRRYQLTIRVLEPGRDLERFARRDGRVYQRKQKNTKGRRHEESKP